MRQKKAKFNIVDLVVLAILIAGVAFVALRMFGGSPAETVSDGAGTYLVTFRADCVSESVAASLVPGSAAEATGASSSLSNTAEASARNIDLGKLVDFSIGESIVYVPDGSGALVRTTKPDHVSVILVCELTATERPTGLQVGKYLLNIGHEMAVCAGNTEINATVWGFRPADTE